MLRASAVGEEAGVPTSTLVCEGFFGLAAASSVGLGMPNLPIALVPGHTGVQSNEVLRRNILDVTLDRVVRAPDTSAERRLDNVVAKRRARRYLESPAWRARCRAR